MNRHFEDAWYYLKRAGQTAKRGFVEEAEPVETWIRKRTGRERDPEPDRYDELRAEVDLLRARVTVEARKVLKEVRQWVRRHRRDQMTG